MKKLSHSLAVFACALSSMYFVGCGDDSDNDGDPSTGGSGGDGGTGNGESGSANGGSGGSSGSAGSSAGGNSSGGSGGAEGGAAGENQGGSGGSDGGTGGAEGGASGENQGGGGAGGSGGAGEEPSAKCAAYCIGTAQLPSVLTKCNDFYYFDLTESICLSECAENEDGPWDIDCRIMHLNLSPVNDTTHCPHAGGENTCD